MSRSSEPEVYGKVRRRKSSEAASTSARLAFAITSTLLGLSHPRQIHFPTGREFPVSKTQEIDRGLSRAAPPSLPCGVQSWAQHTGRAIASEAVRRGT